MESDTLVIMAAGMGSRFGGLKQIEPIDDDGNYILHYSAYDAYRAGFKKIVFVIKEENLTLFKENVGKKIEKYIAVEYVFQKKSDIPVKDSYQERIAPWGTAHAIYCTRNSVKGSFVIINSDDFYGRESFSLAHSELKINDIDEASCISYQYINCVWDNEKVKRAVLVEKNGYVEDLIESSIEVQNDKIFATPLDVTKPTFAIKPDQLVSMNMFVLPHKIYSLLSDEIVEFFKQDRETILKGEILLPDVIKKAIKNNDIKVKAVGSTEKWMGMTYKEDLDKIKARIKEYKRKGIYPEHLFEE